MDKCPDTEELDSMEKVTGFTRPEIDFIASFMNRAEDTFQTACEKGFWPDIIDKDGPRPPICQGTLCAKLLLMHSEISEAADVVRTDVTEMDEKCPDYTHLEIELADLIIRTMDLAAAYNLKIAEAIIAKLRYNKTRPYRHGKKF